MRRVSDTFRLHTTPICERANCLPERNHLVDEMVASHEQFYPIIARLKKENGTAADKQVHQDG